MSTFSRLYDSGGANHLASASAESEAKESLPDGVESAASVGDGRGSALRDRRPSDELGVPLSLHAFSGAPIEGVLVWESMDEAVSSAPCPCMHHPTIVWP